jgi:hypothetical protein
MSMLRPLPLVLLVSLAACDEEMDPDATSDSDARETEGDDLTVDEDAIAEQALDFESLVKLTDEPVASQHGLANTMNLWVDEGSVATYESLGTADFAPGSTIIKEQLEPDGTLNSLAVMFKGPEGYSPDSGDWWFGIVRPNGNVGPGGQPASCVDCHAGVQAQDWAWGLPEGA